MTITFSNLYIHQAIEAVRKAQEQGDAHAVAHYMAWWKKEYAESVLWAADDIQCAHVGERFPLHTFHYARYRQRTICHDCFETRRKGKRILKKIRDDAKKEHAAFQEEEQKKLRERFHD